MAVLKPRNRLVYFRVSEDEFQQLVQLCQREGARSISDLARDAMHRLLGDGKDSANGNQISAESKLLGRLIEEVSLQLQQLSWVNGRQISSAPNDHAANGSRIAETVESPGDGEAKMQGNNK
jgi:hypothetical protein